MYLKFFRHVFNTEVLSIALNKRIENKLRIRKREWNASITERNTIGRTFCTLLCRRLIHSHIQCIEARSPPQQKRRQRRRTSDDREIHSYGSWKEIILKRRYNIGAFFICYTLNYYTFLLCVVHINLICDKKKNAENRKSKTLNVAETKLDSMCIN